MSASTTGVTCVPEQQLDGEGGDRAGQQPPAQGDEVGGSQAVAPARASADRDAVGEHCGAPQPDGPCGRAQAHRGRQHGQQRHEGGQADHSRTTSAGTWAAPSPAPPPRGLVGEPAHAAVPGGRASRSRCGTVTVRRPCSRSSCRVARGRHAPSTASSGRCSTAAPTQPSSHSRTSAALPAPEPPRARLHLDPCPRSPNASTAARAASGPSRVRPPVVRRWWSLKASPQHAVQRVAGGEPHAAGDRQGHQRGAGRARRRTARTAPAPRRSACRAGRMR